MSSAGLAALLADAPLHCLPSSCPAGSVGVPRNLTTDASSSISPEVQQQVRGAQQPGQKGFRSMLPTPPPPHGGAAGWQPAQPEHGPMAEAAEPPPVPEAAAGLEVSGGADPEGGADGWGGDDLPLPPSELAEEARQPAGQQAEEYACQEQPQPEQAEGCGGGGELDAEGGGQPYEAYSEQQAYGVEQQYGAAEGWGGAEEGSQAYQQEDGQAYQQYDQQQYAQQYGQHEYNGYDQQQYDQQQQQYYGVYGAGGEEGGYAAADQGYAAADQVRAGGWGCGGAAWQAVGMLQLSVGARLVTGHTWLASHSTHHPCSLPLATTAGRRG